MGKEFSLVPFDSGRVETRYRRIISPLPHPDSLPTIETLRRYEPRSMRGQPPLVWDRAEDIFVFDKYGNRWLDFSSGVLVANAGHSAPQIQKAIIDQVQSGLLHNYCFPSEERSLLVETLAALAPAGLKKVFLLTTGSEATECAIKLARAHGLKTGNARKIGIIGFQRAFHGRTMGAQQAGGMAAQKSWIVNLDPAIVNVPFPDGFWHKDTSFAGFLNAIEQAGLKPAEVAGVIMETFQGVGPEFAPPEFVQEMERWCRTHNVVLVFDEVQAGFGRTGKFWAFEHYGVVPDLICCGKGISSSLPLSAVIGREEIMDQFDPGSMTSTHSGNPVCCAAALASIRKIVDQSLPERAAALEPVLRSGLDKIQHRHPDVIGRVSARGLVGGLQVVRPGPPQPDPELAHAIVERCFRKGLLLFAPVGAWGQTVKICPPLTITLDALEEGLAVLGEATEDATRASRTSPIVPGYPAGPSNSGPETRT